MNFFHSLAFSSGNGGLGETWGNLDKPGTKRTFPIFSQDGQRDCSRVKLRVVKATIT